jgi:hypothetical protein
LALTAAFVAAAFAPWLPVLLWQMKVLGAARSAETWWLHLFALPTYAIAGRTLVWKEHGQGLLATINMLSVVCIFLPALWLLSRSRARPRPALALLLGLPLLVGLVALKVPMVHSHYLSVAFPAILVLLGCALDIGLERRSWLVWLITVALIGMMAPSLVRVYALPHKTDWRALAATVHEQRPELPVYCYEDLGAAPLGYYLPDLKYHKIVPPKEGPWFSDAVNQMDAEGDRFWFVFYATAPRTLGEEAEVRHWLHVRYQVELEQRSASGPAPTVLFRCRPRSPLW